MFDLGWTELLVIGVVALIVVGPKDLPVLFRNAGRFMGKARGMANEFSRAMNQAADEAGVKDMAQGLKSAANPMGTAMDGVREAAKEMTDAVAVNKFDLDSLSDERAEDARKIQTATAKAATERKASDATSSDGPATPDNKADT